MRIKLQKNDTSVLQKNLFELLNLDMKKHYDFSPNFFLILNMLENIFDNLEEEEFFIRYEDTHGKILILESADGDEFHRVEIKYSEI